MMKNLEQRVCGNCKKKTSRGYNCPDWKQCRKAAKAEEGKGKR